MSREHDNNVGLLRKGLGDARTYHWVRLGKALTFGHTLCGQFLGLAMATTKRRGNLYGNGDEHPSGVMCEACDAAFKAGP